MLCMTGLVLLLCILCCFIVIWIWNRVLFSICFAIFTLFFAHLVFVGLSSTLNDETLASDIDAILKAYPSTSLVKNFSLNDVESYYSATTDRDYKLLEFFVGPGLHTRLQAKGPIYDRGGHTRQPTFILGELRAMDATRVLEVGFGRGYCTFFLATMMPNVSFFGMDLTQRHVDVATKTALEFGYDNVHFAQGDASTLTGGGVPPNIDLIFGVESLCHLDSFESVQTFLKASRSRLNKDGRLVIIDGFRSSKFASVSIHHKRAMELSETGFRIKSMPSKQMWIDEASKHGFSLVSNIDLTTEALPFWELGWRFARVILAFPRFVQWFASSSSARYHTAANLLSVATTAHALKAGTAEYGMLVFKTYD